MDGKSHDSKIALYEYLTQDMQDDSVYFYVGQGAAIDPDLSVLRHPFEIRHALDKGWKRVFGEPKQPARTMYGENFIITTDEEVKRVATERGMISFNLIIDASGRLTFEIDKSHE